MDNQNWDRDFPKTSASFHNKLCQTLAHLPEKKEYTDMNKKMSFKRTLIFAAVAVMALASTAFAVSKIASTGTHSYRDEAFTQMPTTAQAKKVIKASPKLVESFDNGYAFKECLVGHSNDMDEAGKVLNVYDVLSFSYVNGSRRVELSAEKQNPASTFPEECTKSTYGDVDLYALEYISKTVPLDYVKTEQDILDEASGRVAFSTRGADIIEIDTVKLLFWNDSGVEYSLFTDDDSIPSDELAAMAQQVIASK